MSPFDSGHIHWNDYEALQAKGMFRMIKDALEFLVGLGVQTDAPKALDLPGNKVLVVKPDRTTEILDKDRTLRRDSVSSIASLVEWARDRSAVDVWVRRDAVVAIDNATAPTQRDEVTLRLTHSKAWSALQSWNGKPLKQKDAVRALRGPLADTFDEVHLRVFKSLDFTRRNDGSRSVAHTGESLGRNIESMAQASAGAIPERIVFNLPVFDLSNAYTTQVVMAVEVDAEGETIAFFAVGDAFCRGEQQALAEIRSDLADDLQNAAVYLG